MQKINLYIAELMIIFAFIYNNLEKEGTVMKRMMKSKILATALCATVMAGIYASPVMAEKLYYGKAFDFVYVSGDIPLLEREEIKNLELNGKLTVGEIEVDKLNGVKLGDLVDKSALEQEKNARIVGDTALEEKINGESLIRQDADNRLQTAIDQKADKTTVAENTAAIESNKSAIAQEKKDREHADQKLQDQITINKGQIANEATNRANEDKRIEAKFDGEVSRVDGRIDTEVADRKAEVSRLDGRIDKLNDNVQKVGAMAAAIANLHTMGYDPEAPTEIAVGVGQYRDKTGLALGAFHYPNRDFMLSFNVSTAGDEFMGGIGATWKFGRKSPEELRQAEAEKAAKAKLAKAEAAKKAAKDARVAAQQKRHAEMLAARTGK